MIRLRGQAKPYPLALMSVARAEACAALCNNDDRIDSAYTISPYRLRIEEGLEAVRVAHYLVERSSDMLPDYQYLVRTSALLLTKPQIRLQAARDGFRRALHEYKLALTETHGHTDLSLEVGSLQAAINELQRLGEGETPMSILRMRLDSATADRFDQIAQANGMTRGELLGVLVRARDELPLERQRALGIHREPVSARGGALDPTSLPAGSQSSP